MKNKALIILITRNNSVLLSSLLRSLKATNAGFDYDLIIGDNSSDDKGHLKVLDRASKDYKIQVCENDRVEVGFDKISKENIEDYKYFFFIHDDTFFFKENWLKMFVDRANSGFFEPEIANTHLSSYPIGRVASCHQPYRDFNSCKGFPIQSMFLKECLSIYDKNDIWIYKYADQDRTLWTQECLKSSGIWNVNKFKNMIGNDLYLRLVEKLNFTLPYPDEGIAPKNKYPPGECWNKFVLLSEFFNSVMPLANGYRTVGLHGSGFLEQIDGFDNPWSNEIVCHWGTPHLKKWLSKQFNTTPENIHKKLYGNDSVFVLKCEKLIKEYFK